MSVKKVNIARIAYAGLYVGLVVLLFVAYPTRHAWVVLTVYLAALSLAVLISRFSLRRPTGPSIPSVTMKAVHTFARRAFISSVGAIDALGLDYVLVGLQLGQAELGLYAVAGSVSTLPAMVLTGIAGMIVPKMAGLAPGASIQLMRHWVAASLAVDLMLAAGLEIVVGPAIRILFGAEFIPSIACARVLILAWMLLSFRRVLAAVAQAQGRGGQASLLELVGGGIMVIAMPIGGRIDGITGAAAGLGFVALFSCLVLGTIVTWRAPEIESPAPRPTTVPLPAREHPGR